MAKKRIQRGTQREWPKFLGLGALILVVYANSFTAAFVFDSVPIIEDDPRLHQLSFDNLEKIFTLNYWWPSQYTPLYRPLTTLTYLFNYAVLTNNENVAGYHAINFLLHWINAWLVFLLVRRLAARTDVAALAACLFAVHPVNTEAVTNIVGRADLLAALCVLFGGWCYMKSLEHPAHSKVWLGLLAVSACLGVIAKENAVMIVGFIALYDFLWRWPEKSKTGLTEFARPYIALIPSVVLISAIRQWMSGRVPVFGEFFMDNPLIGAPPFQGLMTAMAVIGRYLQLLIFPRTLSSDYSFNQIPVETNAAAIISVGVIAILIVAALWLRRRQKLFSWGVLFLLGMMMPTSNLLLKIGSIMAERFLYLPSIGFCAVAALALCTGSEKFARSGTAARWALPAIVVAAFAARAYVRNGDWHDELSFWRSTVTASPNSFKAHMGYGDAVWTSAQQSGSKPPSEAIDEVIAEQEKARMIIEPNPPIPLNSQTNSVYLRLGRYYRLKGELLDGAARRDEAASFYRKSLEALEKAQAIDQVNNENWRQFRLARGVAPQDVPDMGNSSVYQQLGLTYARLGDLEKCEAAGLYLQRLTPDQLMGYQLVGNAYFNRHRYMEAAVQFVAGVMLDPANQDSWNNVTVAFNALGAGDQVIRQGSAMSLKSDLPAVRQVINDAAQLVLHQLEEAKQFERAQQLREQLMKEYALSLELFRRSGSQ